MHREPSESDGCSAAARSNAGDKRPEAAMGCLFRDGSVPFKGQAGCWCSNRSNAPVPSTSLSFEESLRSYVPKRCQMASEDSIPLARLSPDTLRRANNTRYRQIIERCTHKFLPCRSPAKSHWTLPDITSCDVGASEVTRTTFQVLCEPTKHKNHLPQIRQKRSRLPRQCAVYLTERR